MSPNKIKIIGIDPGLTNLGINMSSYDLKTGIVTVHNFDMITSIALAKKENRPDYKLYGNIIPLLFLEREINRVYQEYQPDYVATEDAFYNPRTPNAVLSLKLCINAIERALYPLGNTLYKIAPRAAKQCVVNGNANKEAIQEAIQKLPDLKIRKTKPLEQMTEHEADSIGITYAFTKLILPDLILKK